MTEEHVVFTDDKINTLTQHPQNLPLYTIVDLVHLALEFRNAHPNQQEKEEWWMTEAELEAGGAFRFLGWLAQRTTSQKGTKGDM